MENNKHQATSKFIFSHPFVIILGLLVIFYGGYIFGQWLYALLK